MDVFQVTASGVQYGKNYNSMDDKYKGKFSIAWHLTFSFTGKISLEVSFMYDMYFSGVFMRYVIFGFKI